MTVARIPPPGPVAVVRIHDKSSATAALHPNAFGIGSPSVSEDARRAAGKCCCSVAPPRVSAAQYVRRCDRDSQVTVYGASGFCPTPNVMESPPPLCGGVADTECVGMNRTIAANVMTIANAAIARRLDCMYSLRLFMEWARTCTRGRQEFTRTRARVAMESRSDWLASGFGAGPGVIGWACSR